MVYLLLAHNRNLKHATLSFTRQAILLEAFAYKPEQMDAIHMLAQDHFNEGRFHLAYIFALRAAQLPKPDNINAVSSRSEQNNQNC